MMTDRVWLVKDPHQGALVTAYWYPDWADEYVEEHPDEGLIIEQIDVAWHEPASHEE